MESTSIESILKKINDIDLTSTTETLFHDSNKQKVDSIFSSDDEKNHSSLSLTTDSEAGIDEKSDFFLKFKKLSGKNVGSFDEILNVFKSMKDNTDFYQKFNKKYGTKANSFADVENYIDKINSSKESSDINGLKKQVSLLNRSKKSYEEALKNLEELIESQNEEIKKLSEQRNQLVQNLQKLDTICRKVDDAGHALELKLNKADSKNEKVVQKQPKEELNNKEDNYVLLAKFIKLTESTQNKTIKEEVDEIKNNPKLTVDERLLKIFSLLSNQNSQYNDDIQQLKQKNQELKTKLNSSKQQSIDILHYFENELRFLQKITHSKELQNVIFYRTTIGSSLALDNEEKEELIKRCASIGAFIDETIDEITQDCPILEDLPDNESVNIFELLQPYNIEKKVSKIIKEFDETKSISTRKLIDLFNAQVIMNEILKNHVCELRDRFSDLHESKYLNEDIQKLSKENQIINEENTQLTKSIKKFLHKEKNAKKQLSKMYEFDENMDFYKAALLIIKSFQNSSHINGNQELTSQIEEANGQIEELQKLIKKQNNEFNEQINNYETKINELTQQNNSINENYEKQKKDVEKITSSKDNTIHSLTKSLEKSIVKLKEANNRIKQFEQQNNSLTSEKQQLMSKLEQKENMKTKVKSLKNENEKTLKELQKLNKEKIVSTQQVQKLTKANEKLINENDELKTLNNSYLIKIKTNEEKYSVEKNTLLSQIQANQTQSKSDIDRIKKQNEQTTMKVINIIKSFLSTFQINQEIPNDLDSALEFLINESNLLKKVQSNYSFVIDDVAKVQSLLNISPGTPLTNRIQKLIEKNESLVKKVDCIEEENELLKNTHEKMRTDLAKAQSQVISLAQWEAWSKRLLRIIRETPCRNMNHEQLRLTIEETLLSSVSNRTMFFRIELLRDEKHLLLNHSKQILEKPHSKRPKFNTILIALIAIRKIQRASGHSPLYLSKPVNNSVISRRL